MKLEGNANSNFSLNFAQQNFRQNDGTERGKKKNTSACSKFVNSTNSFKFFNLFHD